MKSEYEEIKDEIENGPKVVNPWPLIALLLVIGLMALVWASQY